MATAQALMKHPTVSKLGTGPVQHMLPLNTDRFTGTGHLRLPGGQCVLDQTSASPTVPST